MPDDQVLLPVEDATGADPEAVTLDGALRGGRCAACGAQSFPRAYICPTCNGTAVDAVELPGNGSLYSWTTVHISPSFPTPYSLGYVDLADGLRVLGQVIADPADLTCDLPVRAERTDDSPTGWGFRPVEGVTA